jgi:hypothetical protein
MALYETDRQKWWQCCSFAIVGPEVNLVGVTARSLGDESDATSTRKSMFGRHTSWTEVIDERDEVIKQCVLQNQSQHLRLERVQTRA